MTPIPFSRLDRSKRYGCALCGEQIFWDSGWMWQNGQDGYQHYRRCTNIASFNNESMWIESKLPVGIY